MAPSAFTQTWKEEWLPDNPTLSLSTGNIPFDQLLP